MLTQRLVYRSNVYLTANGNHISTPMNITVLLSILLLKRKSNFNNLTLNICQISTLGQRLNSTLKQFKLEI